MHGPGFWDQLGFTLWLIVLHAVVILPILGPFTSPNRTTNKRSRRG